MYLCFCLALLHSERPNLYAILAFLSAIGLMSLLCSLHNKVPIFFPDFVAVSNQGVVFGL